MGIVTLAMHKVKRKLVVGQKDWTSHQNYVGTAPDEYADVPEDCAYLISARYIPGDRSYDIGSFEFVYIVGTPSADSLPVETSS